MVHETLSLFRNFILQVGKSFNMLMFKRQPILPVTLSTWIAIGKRITTNAN